MDVLRRTNKCRYFRTIKQNKKPNEQTKTTITTTNSTKVSSTRSKIKAKTLEILPSVLRYIIVSCIRIWTRD